MKRKDSTPAQPEQSAGRSFWSLLATHIEGAFSDNAFKALVMFMLIGAGAYHGRSQVLLVGALFALPFLLFSMTGGFLADRFSKRTVTISTKCLQVVVMCLGLLGLLWNSAPLLIAGVFLMSVQSALFGPSKYGLLPELLPAGRLSWGNGVLELGTFLAIIFGTVTGGFLAQSFQGEQHWSGVLLVCLAFAGLAASHGIRRVPAADPRRRFPLNPILELKQQLASVRRDRILLLAVIGNTYFWFLAALLDFNILFYGLETLSLDPVRISLLRASVAIGIGIGSLAAGYLSGKRIEYGLIPLGLLGICFAAAFLALPGLSFFLVAGGLIVLGLASGFFVVPINAIVQHRPESRNRGRVIAASYFFSFLGILTASGAYFLLSSAFGFSPSQVFAVGSALTLVGTLFAIRLAPASLLRLIAWFLTHIFYRLEVDGRENLPRDGGALLVSNHLSFIDAALLMASSERPIRFLMFKGHFDRPWIKPFASATGAIPIDSELRLRDMIRNLRKAGQAVADGEIVCIFAEGQVTRIGQMLPFRRGMERIMKGVQAPIVPVHLDGLWGSVFSFERSRAFWKLPRRLASPIRVSFGSPMSPDSCAVQVRQRIQELQTEAFRRNHDRRGPVHRRFVAACRRHPFRLFATDQNGSDLRYGSALFKTVYLARRLRPLWKEQEMVGILLPPSVAGALVNLAALLSGKVPVNLNYTTSREVLQSCIEQCSIRTVVTAQEFLDRIDLDVPAEKILIEKIAAGPRVIEKLISALVGVLPVRFVEALLGGGDQDPDDLATVIFSSGSTGEPKGVMLTHFNIASNLDQLARVFFLEPGDRVLGILPFFHSFGFTGTLLLPATLGLGVIFHPNPLDGAAIGSLVQRHKATFLLATPTFLQAYIRRCAPEQFGSLRVVMAGAEKLTAEVSQAFEDRFGLRPVEGYGCTECAPVVSANTLDYRAPGFRQVGTKRNTAGHPLPGVSVQIVDPNSFEELPPGETGLLLVKGPNVMKGYLGNPSGTSRAFNGDWYVTGDIATLDEDGFITIVDRLKRFSKIGGEMIPHLKVEETLQALAGCTGRSFAVTGVPDPKKGERLVVLHTLSDRELTQVRGLLKEEKRLPNLWRPRARSFYSVESLPFLGTGKLDLRAVQNLARSFVEMESRV